MQEWVGMVRRESVRVGDHWMNVVSAEKGKILGKSKAGGQGDTNDLYSPVPGTGAKGILSHEVPVYGEDLSLVLLP